MAANSLGGLRHAGGGSASDARAWLAAIVEGSGDAIISENLDGIIQSWNGGAARLFGYSADEVIGSPIAILIPEHRVDEELAILAQVQLGKHIGPFETRGHRKDGALVDISVAVSPIRDEDGLAVGTSKIVHDITARRMAQQRQLLLVSEMRHRMKNLFALATAVVSISAGACASKAEVINDIRARLASLARAHNLTIKDDWHDAAGRQAVALLPLICSVLDPFAAEGRVAVAGDDCDVGCNAVSYVALLLYEWATNAAKFGSLSDADGRLEVSVAADGDRVHLVWRETGGPAPSTGAPTGFGSRLEQSLTEALSATVRRDWRPTGLVATIAMPKAVLAT